MGVSFVCLFFVLSVEGAFAVVRTSVVWCGAVKIPCCAIVCGSALIFEGERCRFFSFPLLRCSSCCAERFPNWELHFVICFSVLYRAQCGDALQLYFALYGSPAFVCFD